MTGNKRPFIRPADIPALGDLDVLLVSPFWPFANGKRGPLEMVMTAVPFADVLALNSTLQTEIYDLSFRVGRPFSLRICGEGWIRIEQQLGRDVTSWPDHPVRLFRARKVLSGSKSAVEYIGVRALTRGARVEVFGGFA